MTPSFWSFDSSKTNPALDGTAPARRGILIMRERKLATGFGFP